MVYFLGSAGIISSTISHTILCSVNIYFIFYLYNKEWISYLFL
ncbi:putative membrane protein [Clostridioides difficile P28]|nr:putative membrane protein [Clostridioides difficile P28]